MVEGQITISLAEVDRLKVIERITTKAIIGETNSQLADKAFRVLIIVGHGLHCFNPLTI